MLSQTAEYAVRAMLHLAMHGERPQTVAEIASSTRVPANYLAKVLGLLARGGLVASQRGLHGGSRLGRPAGEITLLDVVDAVDARPRGVGVCPMASSCACGRCSVCALIDGAVAEVIGRLGAKTLEELVAAAGGVPEEGAGDGVGAGGCAGDS